MTMPDWDSVKLRKHADGVEWDQGGGAGIHQDHQQRASTDRITMPQEKTSRPPRKVSWRGRSHPGSQGRQTGEVRVAGVGGHQQDQGGARQGQQVEDALAAIHGAPDLGDDGFDFAGLGSIWWAMIVIPRKSTIRMLLIQIRVTAALWLRGFLKAVMPLEMASIPVRAVQPLEKARSTRNTVRGSSTS
jgi:hypothetical protein